MPLNIEIKAICHNPEHIRKILESMNADHKGTDHQIDTYFNVREGRLKIREGNIENNLIYYKRSNQDGPKRSDVILYPSGKDPGLKNILKENLGVKVVIDKVREIFFIENVKFHIDQVVGLGNFVEIEAIGEEGNEEELDRKCRHFLQVLEIKEDQLVPVSYSDLLMRKNEII